MKCLSVRQPYAHYICAGLKTVENRTWTTKYRGRVLIHACDTSYAWPDADCLPAQLVEMAQEWIGKTDLTGLPPVLQKYHDIVLAACKHYHKAYAPDMETPEKWLAAAVKKYGWFLPSQTIIGEVTISDIVKESTDAFAEPGKYHYVLTDPVLYDNFIINVIGKPRLWNYEGGQL